MDNISNKIYYSKKIIEKNNKDIIRIKYENEEFQNDIAILKAESEKMNEKVKQNQKSKNSLKNYEKKVRQMKEEIQKNKLIYQEILNKEREEREKEKKEIEEFEKARNALISKIGDLRKHLKEKTEENSIKEKELTKANEEYNNIVKDK